MDDRCPYTRVRGLRSDAPDADTRCQAAVGHHGRHRLNRQADHRRNHACERCGKPARRGSRYCSPRCASYAAAGTMPGQEGRRKRAAAAKRLARAAAGRKGLRVWYVRPCGICGATVTGRHPDWVGTCSTGCAALKYKRARAIRKAYARSITRLTPLSGSFSAFEWGLRIREFGRCCAYCHQRVDHLHVEHVIPISRNGSNLIANVVPACQSCNAEKGTLLPGEWLTSGRRRVRAGIARPPWPQGQADGPILADPHPGKGFRAA